MTTKKRDDGLLALVARIEALEVIVARACKDPHISNHASQTYDFSEIGEKVRKSVLLTSLYTGEGNVATFNGMQSESAGYYPSSHNWLGMFLGGCEQRNEQRFAVVIPACVKLDIPFYNPHGLDTTVVANLRPRLCALQTCSFAVVDFTNDDQCLNYTAGFDLVQLFAMGFGGVAVVKLPPPLMGSMAFIEAELIQNVCGKFQSVSLRQRRFEYYTLLKALVAAMDKWQEFESFSGSIGLGRLMAEHKNHFLKPNNANRNVPMTELLDIWRRMKRDFTTDLGAVFYTLMGMLLFANTTLEYINTYVPEWRTICGDYKSLRTTIMALNAEIKNIESDDYNDTVFHQVAMIELVNLTDTAIYNSKHLFDKML